MKIDQSGGSATPLRLTPRPRTAAPAPALPAGTDKAGGNVRQLPPSGGVAFDAARVAAIREDIRAGRYRVDPQRIADGMIASLRDLLPAKKP